MDYCIVHVILCSNHTILYLSQSLYECISPTSSGLMLTILVGSVVISQYSFNLCFLCAVGYALVH